MKKILLVLLLALLTFGCREEPTEVLPSAVFEDGPLHIIGFFNMSSEDSENMPKLIKQMEKKFGKKVLMESRRAWEERSSLIAEESSECARNQGQLDSFLDEYFESHFEEFNRDTMLTIAVQIGLDLDIFKTCLDSGLMKERVFRDKAFSKKYNVKEVPSFIVERNITVSQSLDEEDFQKTIQELLEILR
jgi:predicted DsbA family dithiol-disulfide isomerase